MTIIPYGKVALTSGAQVNLKTLTPLVNANLLLPFGAVDKICVVASDTQTGAVYVGFASLTLSNAGTNANRSIQKPANGQSDEFCVCSQTGDQVNVNDYAFISASATDTVYVYAVIE